MNEISTLELDLNRSQIGLKFETEFCVNEAVQNGFMETFQDRNPLHISDEYAHAVGFKSKVMQGNILNGFISYFVGEVLKSSQLALITQSIRYKNPVYLNDVLKLHVVLLDISEANKMYIFGYEFKNEQVVADGKFQCVQMVNT